MMSTRTAFFFCPVPLILSAHIEIISGVWDYVFLVETRLGAGMYKYNPIYELKFKVCVLGQLTYDP